jgi:hypothetical protein
VTYRATSNAIQLLKTASALQTGERAARALRSFVVGGADLGAGVAKGLGLPEGIGRAAAVAGLGGAAYAGGKRIKRKADELRFRLMYGDPLLYGDPAQYY